MAVSVFGGVCCGVGGVFGGVCEYIHVLFDRT